MMSKSRGIKASRHRGIKCDERPLTRVASHRDSGGFTLIELLIAIAVLLVVILATAHIFGTASKVTGTGHAAASVLQEAAVIERMIRDDIARMSPEGFFAIRQVAVPNDIHGPGQPLLNPMLPPEAIIRADQLVFLADGAAGMQTFGVAAPGGGTAIQGQGTAARVYYGHGFQLQNAPPARVQAANNVFARDPQRDFLPWHRGAVDLLETRFTSNENAGGPNGTGVYQQSVVGDGGPTSIDGTQPEARQWTLARQAVPLVDDDANVNPASNQKTIYLNNNRTARSIFRWNTPMQMHPVFGWTNEIRNGRMDGAASGPDAIRRYIQINPDNGVRRTWEQQWNIISSQAIYYPRAERHAPGPHRVDQALTNHVIGSAVSSFIVEWTWSDGTGDMYDGEGNLLCEPVLPNGPIIPCNLPALGGTARHPLGFYTNYYPPTDADYDFQPEQPWFGLNLPDRGVGHYGPFGNNTFQQFANYKPAYTIWRDNVEWADTGAQFGPPFSESSNPNRIDIYEAIFGYNRNRPNAPNPNNNWFDEPYEQLAYTPWPTAIRVTMVLHDTQGRLEHGREFQFVIDLPKRVRK